MKVTEASTYRLMQTNLDRVTTNLQDLRYMGATGIKLNKSSDDPSAIRPVLTTRTQIRHTDRYLETMGVSLDKMESTDGHLGHVENILQRAKETSINSVNGAMSPEDLSIFADEIAQIKKELFDSANAKIDGKYIFSGYQENTIPFVENNQYDPSLWDANTPSTWPVLYQGDAFPTELEITPGEKIETNLTGNDLFQGISNALVQAGVPTQPPLTGIQLGGAMTGAGGNINLTVGGAPLPAITIPADTPAITNYAQGVANLLDSNLSGTTTGLTVTVNPSYSETSGVFSTSNDPTYSFSINSQTIASGPTASGSQLDDKINSYLNGRMNTDPTLAGGSIDTQNAWFVDGNGNQVNIYGSAEDGDLSFRTDNGADIDITEVAPTGGFTTASYSNSSTTAYGTVRVGTNSVDDVVLAGAGLPAVGLVANTLDGATGYPPDSGRVDIFSILTRTEEALRAGNIDDPFGPGGGVMSNIDNLELAADQERRLRSKLGNKATRVESAMLHQEDVKIDLEQVLSRYQDADAIEVFNEIIKQETAYQAALNITARVSQISILDYF